MNKSFNQIKSCFAAALQALVVISLMTFAASAQNAIKTGKNSLSFSTQVMFGAQKNNLSIVVSTDFNGDYSMEGINKATWTDITKMFELADSKEWKKSGEADISALIASGKPFYVGLKYIGNKSSVGPTQKMWGINEMYFNGKELPSADWKIVNDPNNFEGSGYFRPKAGGIVFKSNLSIIRSESWGIVKVI
ncbi:MAG: DUF5017 domain-containing protein [Pedobacter sp.]|uniref:DUF5017 domain-containing protein n=1 Tax=Pedobacter sp. TaxID=1411316 RepID=UPI0035626A3B